jgi:predicted CXXCH cytochrome family protein
LAWAKSQVFFTILAGLLAALSVLSSLEPALASAPPRVSHISDTCTSCHHFGQGLSHPIGVNPPMVVPAALPLEDGKLTCLTCHDFAGASHELAAQRHDPMLRNGLRPADLCIQCHNSVEQSRKAMHPAAMGRAHVTSAMTTRGASPGSPLDTETRLCLSCHDGTMAVDVGIGNDGDRGSHAGSHPVGIAYANGAATGQPNATVGFGELRPVAKLNSRLRLFNRQVGCGTCHSPFSSEKGLLVMSNHRSQLCLSCHIDR